ncbi:MAG TPA: nitroreductase family protein, partial [Chloroflexota bacterium]|nr:nitroreductase family protein [Chloroflexota bacterium]
MVDTVASERIEFLRKLRSTRQFTSRPILRNVLDDILTVARSSGSGSNQQPWELVVVQKRETLEKLGSVEGYVAHLK